jgi:Fuc2NAc and GlcNAc transferase
MLTAVFIFVLACTASWIFTGLVRRYALSRDIVDVPNQRSSHTRPVPRGGGLAIVVVVCVGTGLIALHDELPSHFLQAMISGGFIVAGIGWVDDHRSVSPLARAIAHIFGAALAVTILGGLQVVAIGDKVVHLGLWGSLLAVLALVWLINLYNFMDGIDGLAGVNALTVGLFAAFLLNRSGNYGLGRLTLLIAGASLGFLFWNWTPARIFLGDVGSGFLGFSFGILAIASANLGVPLVLWMLLLGVFIVDTTMTLVRRVGRRENWYSAHNNHAYQRAVRAGYAHSTVSLFVAVINCVFGLMLVWTQRFASLLLIIVAAGMVFLIGVYLAIERLNPMVNTRGIKRSGLD